MAVECVVVSGYLPTADASYTDFTSSGFGTPTAAIVICNDVISGTNPYAYLQQGLGFWTASNQAALGIASAHAVTTTDTSTAITSGSCVALPISRWSSYNITASGASTTDGLRITKNSGTTSLARYCTVLLIKGTSSAFVGTAALPSSGSSTSITAPGFKPSLLFGAGAFQVATGVEAQARVSFGVGHNNSSNVISQGVVAFGDLVASSTTIVNTTVRNDRWLQQVINNNDSTYAALSSFDASGFSLSYDSSSYTRQYAYLALQLPDTDDGYVGVIDSRTSTGDQAHTGTGFTPVVVGLIGTTLTSVNSLATSSVGSISYGLASGASAQRALIFGAQDGVTTTVTYSRVDASNILNLRLHDGAVDAVAGLSSFDSDGWTLNYSDGSASARKVLAFAIGDATAGGYTHPTLSNARMGSITTMGGIPLVDYTF